MTTNNIEKSSEKKDDFPFIDSLEINPMQKNFIRLRWLDQMKWMSKKSKSAQQKYYFLRLVAIVGGVIVPALVSMNISGEEITVHVRYLTFLISLLVAISVAVEEFFHYGERWRHYRNTAERLKIEGWEFFQLSGPYEGKTHNIGYAKFAGKVEEILREEVGIYMTEIAREKKKTEEIGKKNV